MKVCKNICSECPFSKNSVPGWLGPYNSPQELHRLVMVADQPFPCHKKQDMTLEKGDIGTKRYPLCRGSLAYMKKNAKRHKIPEIQEKMDNLTDSDIKSVFSVPKFIEHHNKK